MYVSLFACVLRMHLEEAWWQYIALVSCRLQLPDELGDAKADRNHQTRVFNAWGVR